jgi:hypothetical protein
VLPVDLADAFPAHPHLAEALEHCLMDKVRFFVKRLLRPLILAEIDRARFERANSAALRDGTPAPTQATLVRFPREELDSLLVGLGYAWLISNTPASPARPLVKGPMPAESAKAPVQPPRVRPRE